MRDLCEWIVEAELVDRSVLEALQEAAPEGTLIETALIERKLIDENALVSLISRKVGIPPAPERLHRQAVPARILSAVPEDLCWQHRFFPFGIDRQDARVKVAMLDPNDSEARDVLERTLGHPPALFVIGPNHLEKAIRKHYLDAWVDDTRAPRKRFFGYDEITRPGVRPKKTPSKPLPAAMKPEPAFGADQEEFSEENTPTQPHAARSREKDSDSPAGTSDDPAAKPSPERPADLPAIGADRPAIGRVLTGRVTLQSRLAALEDTLSELITLIASSSDPELAAAASALKDRLREGRGSDS